MSYDTNGSLDRALELAKKRWLFFLIRVEQAFKIEIQGNAVLEHWQRDRKREQRKEAPGGRKGHPLENVNSQVLVANVLVLRIKISLCFLRNGCTVQCAVSGQILIFEFHSSAMSLATSSEKGERQSQSFEDLRAPTLWWARPMNSSQGHRCATLSVSCDNLCLMVEKPSLRPRP